jgi:hypothetical protein
MSLSLFDCLPNCFYTKLDEEEDHPPSFDIFDSIQKSIQKSLPVWIPKPMSSLPMYKILITSLALCQGGYAVGQLISGDWYSGSYTVLLSTLGISSLHKNQKEFFKTYIVITFINSCSQCMEIFTHASAGYGVIHLLGPAIVSVGVTAIGWHYLKAETAVKGKAYIEELVDRATVSLSDSQSSISTSSSYIS